MSPAHRQQLEALHVLLEAAAWRARDIAVHTALFGSRAEYARLRKAIKLLAPEGAKARLLAITKVPEPASKKS